MGILDRHIQGHVNWKHVKAFDVLGLDELSLKKGHRDFVTIVTGRMGDNTVDLSIPPPGNQSPVSRLKDAEATCPSVLNWL